MEPEQLKVIAEGMGYNVRIRNDVVYVAKGITTPDTYQLGHGDVYSPITNDSQCMEIMEKLGLSLWYDGATWVAQLKNTGYRHLGETINEAVCNAAFEYFNKVN